MKDIYANISLMLRELRKKRGWSLDKASQETGVSKAMLGQIERQESSPTIATLWKIASGFQTSFSSFIEAINEAPYSDAPIFRAGLPIEIHPADNKIRVMPLFPYDNELKFEIFVIDLLPGCTHLSPPHQANVIEHVIVIEGTMEVLVDDLWKPLNKGEGLRFNANQPHGYRNQSMKIATIHDVIHYTNIRELG